MTLGLRAGNSVFPAGSHPNHSFEAALPIVSMTMPTLSSGLLHALGCLSQQLSAFTTFVPSFGES